jgi:inner membrane protein
VVLGKKAGNKAIMWGAVGGLFPDLDVLITPFFSDVNGLFVHRGFSHSLVFAFLLAPLLGWLIYRIHRKKMPITHFDWTKLIFWAAFTHPFLDYLTTYGTGAFLPFSGYRVEFSTVGIVDIFYTIPLLLVLVVIMFFNRASLVRRRLILGIVSLTTFYLAATVGNKIYMNSVLKMPLPNRISNTKDLKQHHCHSPTFYGWGWQKPKVDITWAYIQILTTKSHRIFSSFREMITC